MKTRKRFGRHIPLGSAKLWLGDYITHAKTLPSPPATATFIPKATKALHTMLDNDTLADCVIAAGYHYLGMATANADPNGVGFIATEKQIIADYSAIGNYNGDPSTDNGCDEQVAFAYWMKHGFANGTKLLGNIGIDSSNQSQCALAMYLFESLFYGISLPDKWVTPFPENDGFTWDIAGDPDPENGHAIMGAGYDTSGIKIVTWGEIGTLTWAANAKYATAKNGGELYGLLTDAILVKAQQKAPNGIAWADLIADFNAMGGNVPIPIPTPPIPPTPMPTPPDPIITLATLAQAQNWGTTSLRASRNWYIRPSQAVKMVQSDLAAKWPKQIT